MTSTKDPRKPPFPKPFVDYVMEYHKSHTNSLRFACVVSIRDTSAFAAQLAPYFQHVHVHLLQTEDLEVPWVNHDKHEADGIRKRLTAHHDEHWEQARFTISSGPFAGLLSSIPARSVDMVYFDDWYWEDRGSPSTTVAYELLTANGCLVYSAFSHVPSIPARGEDLTEAQLECFQKWQSYVKEQLRYGLTAGPFFRPSVLTAFMQAVNSGLDKIDLDPSKVYENVTKRIGINCTATGAQVFDTFTLDTGLAQRVGYTRRPQERLIDKQSDLMALSSSFVETVDRHGYLRHISDKLDVHNGSHPTLWLDPDSQPENAKELELIRSAQLILATRNMQKLNW